MAKEPGNLSDLTCRAQQEWDALVRNYYRSNQSEHLLMEPDERTPELIAVDWGAFPARPTACLQSTARANRLLDWTTLQGAIGRAEFQDEYVEWRTVRDVNFGGSTNPRSGEPALVQFLSVVAGGLYAVPPKSDPFPGAEIF